MFCAKHMYEYVCTCIHNTKLNTVSDIFMAYKNNLEHLTHMYVCI